MSEEIRLEGQQGQRDEQKISSVTVRYFVKGYENITQAGGREYRGLIEASRTWEAWDAGAEDEFIVTVIYKGYSGDEPEPQERETEQWSVDFDFTEERLQTHPKIEEIKKKYGGRIVDGELEFDEKMPTDAAKSGGLGGKKLKAGDWNPMFGAKSYLVMYARVTRTWSSKKIPQNAINDIGRVYNQIPGAPQGIASLNFGSRNWMAMPPKISQNGDVWRIENEWMLSPPAGWVEEVYERASKQ